MDKNEIPEVNTVKAENEVKEAEKKDKKPAGGKKPDNKKVIIIAVAACVIVAGIILGIILPNRNVKVPGKKNDGLVSDEPETLSIVDENALTTKADVTAITAATDKDGKVVDSKGIIDISGHKIYDTGEKDKSGHIIYTTGKKASNGRIIYTLNNADSFGNQIYYTGFYTEDGTFRLSNTAEKPDYSTNDTPVKQSAKTDTTTATVKYEGTSKLVVSGAKANYYKYFGGTGIDTFRDISECEDGGYVAVCLSQSYNGDFDGISKDMAIHSAIVKYNEKGEQVWKYIAGGNAMITLDGVTELKDGSVIAVGSTAATDTDAKLQSKTISTVIIRIDKNGKYMWSYSFPGSTDYEGDYASCVDATPDGGFVVGGTGKSNAGFFKGGTASKAYLFKFDKNGNIKWRRTLNGSKSDAFKAVSVADNGDIYATCVTTSQDGDFAGLIKGKAMTKNTVLVKLGKDGDLEWSKNLDGTGNSEFNAVCATSDGCVVAGNYTVSGRADGIYSITYGKSDGYVIRFNEKGDVCWAKNFGGSQNDYMYGVTEVTGGFAIVGNTQSIDYTFQGYGNGGDQDAFVIYLNEEGELSYADTLDGSGGENLLGVCTLKNGTIAAAGTTKSIDSVFKGSGASSQFKAFVVNYTMETKEKTK